MEYAYWNLYASYGELYATDKALVDAYELYKVIRERTKGSIQPPMDEKRTLAQLENFRAGATALLAESSKTSGSCDRCWA